MERAFSLGLVDFSPAIVLSLTENRQKWWESTETHDTDWHLLAGKIFILSSFFIRLIQQYVIINNKI